MVHAICYNKKCFDAEVFERILLKTNGNDAGCLVNSIQNCIESFPDGNIYRSFQSKDNSGKDIIDCGDDIEKFIYVNMYGGKTKEEDMNGYDRLVQLLQDGEIGAVEFIERQPELAEEWGEWLEEHSLKENESTAMSFLEYRDNMAMNCQNHNL